MIVCGISELLRLQVGVGPRALGRVCWGCLGFGFLPCEVWARFCVWELGVCIRFGMKSQIGDGGVLEREGLEVIRAVILLV